MGNLGTEEASGLSQIAEQVWAARCPSTKPQTQAGPAQVSGQVRSPALTVAPGLEMAQALWCPLSFTTQLDV